MGNTIRKSGKKYYKIAKVANLNKEVKIEEKQMESENMYVRKQLYEFKYRCTNSDFTFAGTILKNLKSKLLTTKTLSIRFKLSLW